MTDARSKRAVTVLISLFVGTLAGRVLGPLFVPDPTSTLAQALTLVVGVATAGLVYVAASDSL